MQGTVLSFQPETNTGLISGHDGIRYSFAMIEWQNKQTAPKAGQLVDFEFEEKSARQIIVMKKARSGNDKTKTAAALWAFFLGGLGAHKFYLGQAGLGFLYLCFFWTFIPAFVAFVEFVIYLTMSDEAFDDKYNS
jgi:TM2 domain-containing membrane protein YozV/cold shock CspA family protein